MSEVVDVSLARLLKREVSDGIIAPGYETEALSILSRKKEGGYVVLEMDPDYQPPPVQIRDVFGITLEEKRNDVRLDLSILQQVVTNFSEAAHRNALVAAITLKYTQSNSVCVAADGQSIGVGAGQQSRIRCTRIACDKADLWRLRQHPSILELPFKPGLHRPDLDNGLDLYLRDDATGPEKKRFATLFEQVRHPSRASRNESG